MIRSTLFLVFIISSLSVFNQNVNEQKQKTCLFGYISEYGNEFEPVVSYLESINIKVINTCTEENLIYIQLNEKNKDYTSLFNLIEENFSGKCYFKSEENKIPLYDKCRGQYIKKNIK